MIVSPDLIRACLKHDRIRQKELFGLLLPYLKNLCFRYLRNTDNLDDAIQMSFIRIFNKLESFDGTKGTLKSWVGKIAINSSLEINRTEKINSSIEETKIKQLSIPPSAIQQMSAENIMTLIGSLPNDQREVFMMNAIDGYSHQEIGEILGIDEATSRKRLSRAREALRELLSEEESTKPSKKPSVQ